MQNTNGKPRFKALFLGLLIGALGGALGMHLYQARTEKPAPPAARAECAAPAPQAPASATPTRDARDFNFYGVLERAPVTPAPRDEAREAAAIAQPGAATVAASKPFYLQVASFKAETDADALKAKIVMTGQVVHVVASEIPGQGMRYRVRVGPFASQDELARAKLQLQQGKVEVAQAFVVR